MAALIYIRRPKQERFPDAYEMEFCNAHWVMNSSCDDCPNLRHASPRDVYCALNHVWQNQN